MLHRIIGNSSGHPLRIKSFCCLKICSYAYHKENFFSNPLLIRSMLNHHHLTKNSGWYVKIIYIYQYRLFYGISGCILQMVLCLLLSTCNIAFAHLFVQIIMLRALLDYFIKSIRNRGRAPDFIFFTPTCHWLWTKHFIFMHFWVHRANACCIATKD